VNISVNEVESPVRWMRIARLFRGEWRRLSIVGVIVLASSAVTLASPFLLREILDVAIPEQRTGLLTILALSMIGISVCSASLAVIQTTLSATVGQRVMHFLRSSVYRHLQTLSLDFYTKTRAGEIQSRICDDIGKMQSVVTSSASALISSLTTIIATIVAMFALEWRLAIVSVLILPGFMIVGRKVGRARQVLTQKRQHEVSNMTSFVSETLSITGFLLGRTYGRSDDLARDFSDRSGKLSELELSSSLAGRWHQSSFQMVMASLPAIIYWAAGLTFGRPGGGISVGTVVAFTALQNTIIWPANSLLRLLVETRGSVALFDRVFEYLDQKPGVIEKSGAVRIPRREIRGDLSIDDVHFSYESSVRDGCSAGLHGVSLSIPAGSHIAVVGETGSGKSTLALLIARLYDPDVGSVKLDGLDMRDLSLDTVSSAIGIVTQETYLFHASIAENLRFAKPHASQDELEEVCRISQIHERILRLPKDYQTTVGERGFQLSGGERQRLSIARALLYGARVLILDEATSALDSITEKKVQEALKGFNSTRTVITIAHRMATVREADQIVVISEGRMQEIGTHDSLMSRGGYYAGLNGR
jgi:ATP-binding cassette, subfamily B, bacterial